MLIRLLYYFSYTIYKKISIFCLLMCLYFCTSTAKFPKHLATELDFVFDDCLKKKKGNKIVVVIIPP